MAAPSLTGGGEGWPVLRGAANGGLGEGAPYIYAPPPPVSQ